MKNKFLKQQIYSYLIKIICLIFFISGKFAFAQSEISGTVKDTIFEPIPFAHVYIKPKGKENIVAFGTTNAEGKYQITLKEVGYFELYFSAVSYKTKIVEIDKKPNIDIVEDIILKNEISELDEVILFAEIPIRRRADTVSFKADAYTKGNEQVIEDLLKTIPGLTVEDDGTIKVGNREIEKVMIDGDDFFERGYKLLTKNMGVESIDRVEVHHRYSNNRLLKGIEESERVALNLTLKEGKSHEWFGNASLTYGLVSENRYAVRTNLMSFGKKSKYYFLTNLNNVGTDATGDLNHLIRPVRFGEPGSIGDNHRANTFLSLSGLTPRLQKNRYNFNNTELGSLNAIFTLGDNMKLKTVGVFNWDENNFFRNSFHQFQLDNETFVNTEDFKMRKKSFTGFGKVDYVFDISQTQTLEYVGKYNITREDTRADLLFNSDKSREFLNQNNELIDNKISYTNQIESNKVFLLTGRYFQEKTPQQYSNSQFLFEELFPNTNNSDGVTQHSENKMKFAGIEAHYMNRYDKGGLLELLSGVKYIKDYLNTQFSILEEEIENAENFINAINFQVIDLYTEAKYLHNYKNFNFIGSLSVHQFVNRLKIPLETEENSPFFLIPSIATQWKINNKNEISFKYRYNMRNATLQEAYPSYVLTNFRTFSSGTGSLNQLNSSSFTLDYQMGNIGDRVFSSTRMNYVKNHDYFSTNNIINSDFSVSDKALFKGQETFSISTNTSLYLGFISSRLRLNAGYTQTSFQNVVNTVSREINNINYWVSPEIRSAFLGVFNFHFGTRWMRSKIDVNSSTFDNTDNRAFADLIFDFGQRFNVSVFSERYYFKNLPSNENVYHFLDFSIKYTTKSQKLNFLISGKNLFHTKSFREVYVSDINLSVTEYRLLPRFILLSVDFKF